MQLKDGCTLISNEGELLKSQQWLKIIIKKKGFVRAMETCTKTLKYTYSAQFFKRLQ